MNILIPRFNMRPALNKFWQAVKGNPVAAFMSHEAHAPLAYDLSRYHRQVWFPGMAEFLLGAKLKGAGYSFESRRWLHPASDAAIATTGANTVNFNCYDFFSVSMIGFCWTVAGTVTALVMDFDRYPRVAAGGTVVDKLDGSNGVITAPTVAGQAAGNRLYKDLGDNTGVIDLDLGDSVQAIVTTTTTAGNGIPFVVGFTRSQTMPNLSTAVASS
jgi:hypothetical protein